MNRVQRVCACAVMASLGLVFIPAAMAEVILQYFNTSWNELAARMPELAEAGYTALWLPPPFKAGNQFSVGFDSYDRFDYGNKDQMGGVPTRYGSASDLLNVVKMAHRCGIRVYFDNVMAHNGGPIPGYDEWTPVTVQPGFRPEDFHLIMRADGTFRKNGEYPDYNDEWQVLNYNPFGIDIAQENPNTSFGPNINDDFPKYYGVRQPDNPEYYLDTDLQVGTTSEGYPAYTFANKEPYQDVGYGLAHTGAGNGRFDWNDANGNSQHDAGETAEPFTDTGIDPSNPYRRNVTWGYGDGKYNMGNIVAEDVNSLLIRAARWFTDQANVDGFRLDAVKHVPYYFFGKVSGGDKDYSNWGYCGGIQEQFNLTRGFSDWSNHRDTLFNDQQARDDAMFFGEHIAAPPDQGAYIDAGMRIADNDIMGNLSWNCSGWGNLSGQDQPGYGTRGWNLEVLFIGSHDNNYISIYDRPSAHALLLTRSGLPIVYTDGYNEETVPDSDGKLFPQNGDNAFVGQFGDSSLPNLLYINQCFVRGPQVWDGGGAAIEGQIPKWSDEHFVAYERRDKRENQIMTDEDGTTLLFMMARNGAPGGQSRGLTTTFPPGARLVNYSYHGGPFYAVVQSDRTLRDTGGNSIIVDPGKYFAFSWRNPEMPATWDAGIYATVKPILLFQNGQPVPTIAVTRRDGRNGDPNFNPYGLPDTNATDYSYTLNLPRVTSSSNLSFVARADGSAENILMRLDSGVDINSQMGLGPLTGDLRDHQPISSDVYVGYEQMQFVDRIREKFAAADVSRNLIGSPGCESFVKTIGSGYPATNKAGSGANTSVGTVHWVYHDPNNVNVSGAKQYQELSTNVEIWVKVGYRDDWYSRVLLYYSLDGGGNPYPEGSHGVGSSNTLVCDFNWKTNQAEPGATADWWRVSIPKPAAGTTLRYKIGVYKSPSDSVFPWSESDIALKKRMETIFEITNFNARTTPFYPHNDYGLVETNGLEEGFHVLRTKTFLQRSGGVGPIGLRAAIYHLNVQTFYYDTRSPEGVIVYPANNGDTLGSSSYGVVARVDRSVVEAWYRITDSRADNDDSVTGVNNGNGAWVKAVETTPNLYIASSYPREFRFAYVNIPSNGTATIEVRLREVSSSSDFNLNDATGHFTTLTRTVNTRGPEQRLYVAWPNGDGQVIPAGYVLKACFTKSLADGLSAEELLDCFTVEVDGQAQAQALSSIVYNETPDCHALAFAIPSLFDGIPEHQHTINVSFLRASYPALAASRMILAQPGSAPYVAFYNPPALDEQGNTFRIILPDVAVPAASQRVYTVKVETAPTAQTAWVTFALGTGTLVTLPGNPSPTGSLEQWQYSWTFPLTNDRRQVEGSFQLRANVDTDGNTNSIEAFALRDVSVVLREKTGIDTNDLDNDDDGVPDADEADQQSLPTTPYYDWINNDVHLWTLSGRTPYDCPDADGDGLPDGLELGWRQPGSATLTNRDINGDGYPTFLSDLDPPFYNTGDNYGRVPGVSPPRDGMKTDLKAGSVTDPNNPDTDYDGLPDGVEDANHNGWVDEDGTNLPPTWLPWLERNWPNGIREAGEAWTETDPNNDDTDGDGALDGHGEDKNANGRIDGDTNSNRIWEAGELWTETDPLNADTDGDGLPDGWETGNQLDPFDDGVPGHTNLQTGLPVSNLTHGAKGDPDSDGRNNAAELAGGTNPRAFDSGTPPPPGQIVIGPATNIIVAGSVTNRGEFTDWATGDLIALDPYDPLEEATSGGDVYYRPWASDGLESSRDLVAFYAHDGGATENGGDGKFYFRVDLENLQAGAQNNGLDIYVVLDAGTPSVGEKQVVDNVEVLTDIRWEAVVAVYDENNGRVYVNTPGSPDTSSLSDTITYSDSDVQIRDKNHADGFKQAYFNSDLDAVEFSISRKALTDAGWSGSISNLNFQVFTTRDGTTGGAGELDGPDIADSLRTDWIAEDYAGINKGDYDRLRYENRIALTTLSQWVGLRADNDCGKAIKIISLAHGNQHVQPGSVIQALINNGAGGGYYRPLDTHEAFRVPLTLHVTPTLASALEWAAADPAAGKPWQDGPAFNRRLAALIAAGTVDLLGSTFSDHMLPYFTDSFNTNNALLAREFLDHLYGAHASSTNVCWTPERLADADVLAKLRTMGYAYTFLDQMMHLRGWFGYNAATGIEGYRINTINGLHVIPISDQYNGQRFSTLDRGPTKLLRELLSRRVRTGTWDNQQPQVMTFMSNWEDFGARANADAYDQLVRWLASKGWVKWVTPDQIANQAVDISLPPDGVGDYWNRQDRGTGLTLAKYAQDWVQYSCQGNYDNWYLGSGLNSGLYSNKFNLRPGVPMPTAYGMLYYGGLITSAWGRVQQIGDTALSRTARAVLHGSVFETAFHAQSTASPNLTKFTDGTYAYPDGSHDVLADFASYAQSQSRLAAVYQRVDAWSGYAGGITTPQALAEDVDLDGEDEYLLYNDRLFGLFERIGGRLIAVWVRDILTGEVLQAAGNLASFPGGDSEREGEFSTGTNGAVTAFRTSCLKDWWSTRTGAGAQYVNDLYSFTWWTNGWRMVSSDGEIQKTVTLAPRRSDFEVSYRLLSLNQPLYVRHGFSANLNDLLLNGQRTLGAATWAGGVWSVANTNYQTTVRASVGCQDGTHQVGLNLAAVDDNPGGGYNFTSYNMRNQAQTVQVELVGTNQFAFSLGFTAGASDADGDGMPNDFEDTYSLNPGDPGDAGQDVDSDGVPNRDEYIAGTSPRDGGDYLRMTQSLATPTGIVIRFTTKNLREYGIWYDNDPLVNMTWLPATNGIPGTGGIRTWVDDGAVTEPHPLDSTVTQRFYRIEVSLPQ